MKIVFVSNYFNHHQSAVCEEFYKKTGGNFVFIQTQEMAADRKALKWGMEELPEYVKLSYSDENAYEECQKLIFEADVVIMGSAPECMIKRRMKAKKFTFRYSERIYKKAEKLWQLPLRMVKYHLTNTKNTHLLCASAYAAADYAKTFNFLNRTYKWGYFPKFIEYENIEKMVAEKEPNSILWVGRLIELKHPEKVVEVAEMLKGKGCSFDINIVGIGPMEDELKRRVEEKNLAKCVHFRGAVTPEKVREYMCKSEIYVFTSDFNEGWGAVLYEAMNAGCGVVASHAIGAVPYLLADGENGYIYENENTDDLCNKVSLLFDNKEQREKMGVNAYHTIEKHWAPSVAVDRFLKLTGSLLNGGKDEFEKGVCSKAERLRNDWYKAGI